MKTILIALLLISSSAFAVESFNNFDDGYNRRHQNLQDQRQLQGEQYQYQQRLDRDFQNQQRYNDNVRQQNRNGRLQRSLKKGPKY
jgi:hypothetical protein